MKTAIGILSIYIVMLTVSFSPGVHIFENHENCCQTEQHACADSHDICCTLFRTCSICHSNGFIVCEIARLQVKSEEISTEIDKYTQTIYTSPYIKGIFQPPKFA